MTLAHMYARTHAHTQVIFLKYGKCNKNASVNTEHLDFLRQIEELLHKFLFVIELRVSADFSVKKNIISKQDITENDIL